MKTHEEEHRLSVFLVSILLFAGTFIVSLLCKDFRTSSFFPTSVRYVLSDFAVVIAILTMSLVDWRIRIDTPKLLVPESFAPTRPDRGWLVGPMKKNPSWSIFAAAIPALLASILIFMDQQITAVIINRRDHKLKVTIELLESCLSISLFSRMYDNLERLWLSLGSLRLGCSNCSLFGLWAPMVRCCYSRELDAFEFAESGLRIGCTRRETDVSGRAGTAVYEFPNFRHRWPFSLPHAISKTRPHASTLRRISLYGLLCSPEDGIV